MYKRQVFGPCSAREEVLAELEKDEALFAEYQRLSQGLKEEFLHFCMGVNGMRITYDPMFKFVFDPGTKPERLEEFISLCLGEKVKILQVIPNESGRLTEDVYKRQDIPPPSSRRTPRPIPACRSRRRNRP